MAVRLTLVAIVVLVAFVAGWATQFLPISQRGASNSKWELSDVVPDWIFQRDACVAPDEQERKIFEAAVSILELNEGARAGFLELGAKRFLSAGLYRPRDKTVDFVCFPDDIYERVSKSAPLQKEIRHRVADDELRLFMRLPKLNPHIIDAIGRTAFNEHPQRSEHFRERDIRPYARTVLAGTGQQAAAFSATAFQQMSSDDSLGTGAAQIAAATGHPEALSRIRKMMQDLLSSVPAEKPIPYSARNRFYELAYAVYFSDDAGREYIAPIKAFMTRKVYSWAPPFGMIELQPKRMCRLLERIEGPASIQGYNFCLDPKIPLEQ